MSTSGLSTQAHTGAHLSTIKQYSTHTNKYTCTNKYISHIHTHTHILISTYTTHTTIYTNNSIYIKCAHEHTH